VISPCPNHFVLLLFLGHSLSCAYLFFESTRGLGEATCIYAVFMPTSFRIFRVSGKINQTNRKAFYPEAGAAPAIHPTASCEIAGSLIYAHY
jgi:hypothetical protein